MFMWSTSKQQQMARVHSVCGTSRNQSQFHHKTMAQRFQDRDDFEATIRIFHEGEGGRHTPPRNGIRWDLCYVDDDPNEGLWMVWPDFLDQYGESLSEEEDLPVGVPLPANMMVLSDEMRPEVHRKKAKIGVRFYCHEGQKRVAEGVITNITHLFDERKKPWS